MRVLAALAVCLPLAAQAVSVGVRAGIPITDSFTINGHGQAPEPRFTIGPLIEFRLWRDARMGVDFLFRHEEIAAWRWEAPITFVCRFRARAQPFVRGGVSFNRVYDYSGGNAVAELRHRGTYGFVVGGGPRFRVRRIWLDLEVRWTRWVDRNFGTKDSVVRSNLNQADVLLGVVF